MLNKIDIKELRPIPGYVLVQGTESDTQAASGILLPTNDSEKPVMGEVLAVGESICAGGVKEIKAPVQKGDKILYKGQNADTIELNGEEYSILKFENILAKVKE